MRRPRRLSRPARSERRSSRGDTPWGSRSRRGTWIRRPSAVTTTATRLRLRPWKKSKRPDSLVARHAAGSMYRQAVARRNHRTATMHSPWPESGCRRNRGPPVAHSPQGADLRGLPVPTWTRNRDDGVRTRAQGSLKVRGEGSRGDCESLTRGLWRHRRRRRPTRSKSRVSGCWINRPMPTPEFEAAVRRATRRRHATLAEDLARFREDAGESRTRLAAEAGVDRRYLDRIEDGRGDRRSRRTRGWRSRWVRTWPRGSTRPPGR
jgi:hypothetical protein